MLIGFDKVATIAIAAARMPSATSSGTQAPVGFSAICRVAVRLNVCIFLNPSRVVRVVLDFIEYVCVCLGGWTSSWGASLSRNPLAIARNQRWLFQSFGARHLRSDSQGRDKFAKLFWVSEVGRIDLVRFIVQFRRNKCNERSFGWVDFKFRDEEIQQFDKTRVGYLVEHNVSPSILVLHSKLNSTQERFIPVRVLVSAVCTDLKQIDCRTPNAIE